MTCPGDIAGVPFSNEQEFAGTSRSLANDQGVLVRFSLFCPYARQAGAATAFELTLAWSLFEADDLQCEEIEITSEAADGGRVRGVLDDPNVSARVSYDGRSADDLPAIRDAATQLLADVPPTAFPCEGGAQTGVDASVVAPEDEETSDLGVGVVAALGVVAASAALLIGGAMIASRLRRRRRRREAVPVASGLEGVEVLRRRPEVPPATQTPEECWAKVAEMDQELQALGLERDRHAEDADRAAGHVAGAERALVTTRTDLAGQQANVAAVRNIAASRHDPDLAAYLASYAGLTTLAAAGTNLLAAGARRAAALLDDEAVDAAAARVDDLARQAGAAAETGLEDSRYWLWADRRLSVSDAFQALAELAPRYSALQRRLIVRVQEAGARLLAARLASEEAAAAVASIDDQLASLIDTRNRQATTAQIFEERARGDLVPAR